nr:hypothetical protein [Tanacetum cinerariifolium]
MIISKLDSIQKFVDEIGKERAISDHILRAAAVQIQDNNLDNLHPLREEDGTLETMDLQDLPVLGVFVYKAIGFLEVTSVVVVILVKRHSFPTIVKVRPVGCDPLTLVDGFTPVEDNAEVESASVSPAGKLDFSRYDTAQSTDILTKKAPTHVIHLCIPVPKTDALPLGYTPYGMAERGKRRTSRARTHGYSK